MTSPIAHLEPAHLWARFDDIRKVPRPSKHEEKIRQWVLDFAKEHGLETRSDALGNVVVCIPAKPGFEDAPTVIIQGHLDMVCEKNADKEHDFFKDPIELVLDGDILRANGTTLGADNGVAIAAGLGLVTDDSVKHGPIEVLCTLDEETGLTGARQLDPSILTGKLLLNLDSEEDGVITMGCAGGRDTEFTWSVERTDPPAGASPVAITVRGLKGGHSGIEIHLGRANAVKCLVEAVRALGNVPVVSLDGGNAHNAIPREATAVVWGDVNAAKVALEALSAELKSRYAETDPGIEIVVAPADEKKPLDAASATKVLDTLEALPHGVVGMSKDFPDLVETSQNVAVVKTGDDKVEVLTSTRSSIQSEMDRVVDEGVAIGEGRGARTHADDGYPGWAPNPKSELLAIAVDVYESLYGEKPKVEAIHAGLECGLIGEKVDGMDMISFGPTIRNPHSPTEQVSVSSVKKMLGEYLNAILARVAGA